MMMQVLIIEDEKPAAEKLQKALLASGHPLKVIAVLPSVQEASSWLKNNAEPDLIFMDIALSDGLSFKIFENVTITCPVVFTTAYDEYWQEAFEYNSIDYLLKPIKQEKLDAAILKYQKLQQHFSQNLQPLLQWKSQTQEGYKKRCLVKRGIEYVTIKTEEIAYLYATHKLVCLVNAQGQKFILDKSLSDIEKDLDPVMFFRINRKYLAQINAIGKIKSFSKGKIWVELTPAAEEEIIISQENTSAFKEWLGA
jgi:two-component system LytT family response regulator